MLRLSARARYALRFICELGRMRDGRRPVGLSEIATRSGTPRRVLEQIATLLKKKALVRGVPGRFGGYVLDRPASAITVRLVFEAVAGPLRLAPCIEDPKACVWSDFCECRPLWLLVTLRVNELLDRYSINDLLSGRLPAAAAAALASAGASGAGDGRAGSQTGHADCRQDRSRRRVFASARGLHRAAARARLQTFPQTRHEWTDTT